MITYFPKYFSNRAIGVYATLLVLVSVMFGYPMTWYWWVFGIVEVTVFFFVGSSLSKNSRQLSNKRFIITIIELAFILRALYVVFSYFFYLSTNGSYFEFGAADSYTYHLFASHGAEMIQRGEFNFKQQFDAMGFFSRGVDIADMGYPIYLSFIYLVIGKSLIISRLIKSIISALTILFVYRIAQRNFNEPVARMTAIFCALMPNLIYYCSTNLKEVEMLFLVTLFIERADAVLRSRTTLWGLIPVFAIAGLTYFLRAVLAPVLLLAFFTALLLSSKKVVSKIKKVMIGVFAFMMLGIIVINRAGESVVLMDYTQVQAQQEQNMSWRSSRDGGNRFASSASTVVFAPLIFTLPFPTMVNIPDQETQQLLSGGNFVKNVTSFFTILALILLLFSGEWREKVLPIAFLCGYLAVLAFSNYAQSERFHIPILPLSLMFAAYGISQMKNSNKNLYTYWLAFLFVVNIGWQWFKLRGRGM